MKAYDTKKVYLAYLDATRHVHWHLFPRKQGGIEGFDLMTLPQEDTPKEDLEMVSSLRSLTIENLGTK
jgi:diadenosine tetraphosphate (Ap4A) HIT family hydrolase